MKQRVITAVVGLVLFFVILFFYKTIIFDIAVLSISLLVVHELLLATKCTKNIPLTISAMVMSTAPFLKRTIECPHTNDIFSILVFLIYVCSTLSMFLILLDAHEKIKYSTIAVAFSIATFVPLSLVSLVGIRNHFTDIYEGLFYILLIFAVSWGADTGAYFAGRYFGKRKLAPTISPNKTIEGLYGGVISSIFFVSLVTLTYYLLMQSMGREVYLNYFLLLVWAIVGSLLGVLGDLSASVIKRQCEIKDFGSIFPGHGGALDRFDSVLFVAPILYEVIKVFNF